MTKNEQAERRRDEGRPSRIAWSDVEVARAELETAENDLRARWDVLNETLRERAAPEVSLGDVVAYVDAGVDAARGDVDAARTAVALRRARYLDVRDLYFAQIRLESDEHVERAALEQLAAAKSQARSAWAVVGLSLAIAVATGFQAWAAMGGAR